MKQSVKWVYFLITPLINEEARMGKFEKCHPRLSKNLAWLFQQNWLFYLSIWRLFKNFLSWNEASRFSPTHGCESFRISVCFIIKGWIKGCFLLIENCQHICIEPRIRNLFLTDKLSAPNSIGHPSSKSEAYSFFYMKKDNLVYSLLMPQNLWVPSA